MKGIYKKSIKSTILALGIFSIIFFIGNIVNAYSNLEIKQLIIKNSISKYKGSCPCPYSVMKNGKNCGKRSAYSKPGGKSPICYENDVTDKMIKNYK